MDSLVYWIWLSGFELSGGELQNLLEYFYEPQNIYRSKETAFPPTVSRETAARLCDKNLDKAYRIYNDCENKGIYVIPYGSSDYPESLTDIYDPPAVLYAKGNIFDWNSLICIGIVGTRSCDSYGESVTKYFAGELAKRNIMIVSGMAYGIDAIAAQCAIDEGKPTIAVFGNGVDIVYPSGNAGLYGSIEKNGLMLSEYPPGTRPARWTFPRRNRIISGLCRGVLVTEAPEKSGAVISAKYAREYGRDVFAVPGDIFSSNCTGTNRLITSGAVPVLNVYDILREYPDLETKIPKKVKKVHAADIKRPSAVQKSKDEALDFDKMDKLNDLQKKICKFIADGEKHIDDMVRELSLSPSALNSELLMLEINGIVTALPGNKYEIKRK